MARLGQERQTDAGQILPQVVVAETQQDGAGQLADEAHDAGHGGVLVQQRLRRLLYREHESQESTLADAEDSMPVWDVCVKC